MKIINVIEIRGNQTQSLKSFVIVNDESSETLVNRAETLFIQFARENGCTASKTVMGDHIEDGYYMNDDYAVNLVWSDI